MSIESRFKGIEVRNHAEESKILIRRSYNPFRLFGPIAVVECSKCESKYKKPLPRLHKNEVRIGEEFMCKKCGTFDHINYARTTS